MFVDLYTSERTNIDKKTKAIDRRSYIISQFIILLLPISDIMSVN